MLPTCLQNQIESRATCQAKPQATFQTRTQAKISVVLLLSRATETQRNNGIKLGDDLFECYQDCGMPIMGYYNGEADGGQVNAAIQENPYIAAWLEGLGPAEEMDHDLDLIKDAAEVFEQQCASNV